VAEGLETSAQLEQLKSIVCDSAQGFFFSKPLSVEECGEFLSSYRSPELTRWGRSGG